MDSITERASANARRRRDEDKREVDYYVRAKTGPGRKDWTTIGVAFTRRNNEPGFTVKLNTLPIDKNWNGSLILVPPLVEKLASSPIFKKLKTASRRRAIHRAVEGLEKKGLVEARLYRRANLFVKEVRRRQSPD